MKDIFYQNKDSKVLEEIEMDWPANKKVILAGTPVDENGELSNDGDVYGIVEHDIYPRLTITGAKKASVTVAVGGVINLDDAQALSGVTYADACLEALAAKFVLKNGDGTDYEPEESAE